MSTTPTKQSKSEKETQLAVKPSEDIALQSLRDEFAGTFNVRTELLKIPYLRLVHGTSEAFKSGLAKDGDFACSLRAKNYGNKVTIIPLHVSESASLLFSPKNPPRIMSESEKKAHKNGDVLCSSDNLITNNRGILCRNCPYGEYYADWGPSDNKIPPKCKDSIDIICLVDGEEKSVMINFRKSNHSSGKALINLINNDVRKIQFGSKYTLTSKTKPSDDGDYWIISEAIIATPLTVEEFNSVVPIARSIARAKNKGEIIEQADSDSEDIPV